MITNEYQYKISKARIQKFQKLIDELSNSKEDIDQLLIKAQIEAIRSQINDIEEEIFQYDDIKNNKKVPIDDLLNFKNIPASLIKARIGLNLTQKEFAELLGVKEQQIQRWESTEYASTSISRVNEIIKIILKSKGIILENVIPLNKIFSKLSEIGLNKDFIINHFSISKDIGEKQQEPKISNIETLSNLGKVYSWQLKDILAGKPLSLVKLPQNVIFKLPKGRKQKEVHAYTIYAHYLALLIDSVTENIPIREIFEDPYEINKMIVNQYNKLSLENCVSYIWNLGIPIFALDDPGVFNAACFRIGERYVIILKQKTRFEARWMFDLFHELWHVISGKEKIHISVDSFKYSNEEERKASLFSAAVLLGKNPQTLAKKCVATAKRDIKFMKGTIKRVAMEEGVRVDVLANYLAYRLDEQGYNIWGIAQNLQEELKQNPFMIFKKELIKHSNLKNLSQPDFNILQRALDYRRDLND